ncbi:MAG TPA: glycosyltransferase family 4 protein [Chthonomonas sp.]|uniref:glycosyltransferase family 4 protein n=1 Tax=Chthonomonas sp. TaxID=2282153 RepID=UPI002B4AFA9A|nr:glycosyltransferase family 4 protein [Chthonomonas sp.]HLI49425.1 glycosyltransferase family 4 protein [Chthonomonas sp.]
MRILIVMPLAEQRGGAELLLVDLLRAGLNLAQWEAIFLQPEGPLILQLESLGVPTCATAAGRIRQPYQYLKTLRFLVKQIRRVRPDCVFSWMSKAHLYAGPAAWLTHTPALWYQHGIPALNNTWDRAIARIPAKGIVATSQKAADEQTKLRPHRPMLVVPPGTDLQRFDPLALEPASILREQLGLPTTGALIGMVGRLQRWKGMHTLIEAMPLILQAFPDAHCVIVGGEHALEPDYPAYLQQRIGALGLQSRVILAGFQKNVEQWIQACDVFVHASDNEPFGIVVIEAMALGKPVVAGAEGGPREIITEGVDGLFAPYGQPEALAQAVLRYLQNPEFARQMGEAARRRAQEFSIQRYAQRFVKAVQTLLSG